MKIFNWMLRNRCSNYNVHPSEVSLVEDGSSARRSRSSFRKSNIEKEPLLEEDVKAVEDWELDRILTIGTLAIDPLEITNMQDEEADNGEDEQPYNHNDYHDDKNDTILLNSYPQCDTEVCKLYTHQLRDMVKICNDEIEVVEEEIMYERLTNMGKRVTLLDLFLADEKVAEKENATDGYGEGDDEGTKVIMTKKKKHILYRNLPAALGGKKGFSSKPNDIRPLKKLHRFMTKMLKRKIHPDMEARMQKKGQGKLNDDVLMGIDGHDSTDEQYPANGSVSMLPTQGAALWFEVLSYGDARYDYRVFNSILYVRYDNIRVFFSMYY